VPEDHRCDDDGRTLLPLYGGLARGRRSGSYKISMPSLDAQSPSGTYSYQYGWMPDLSNLYFLSGMMKRSYKCAAGNSDYDKVQRLLSQGIGPSPRDLFDLILLPAASKEGHYEIIRLLIENRSLRRRAEQIPANSVTLGCKRRTYTSYQGTSFPRCQRV
jgi:hypothetical protein